MAMVGAPLSLLMGFNNNVRYRGFRFHIQTEDSGLERPHIITHLFADGGQVIQSVKTNYSEHLSRPNRMQIVLQMMKDQHKAMALKLRHGEFDERIDCMRLVDSRIPPPASDSAPRLVPENSPSAWREPKRAMSGTRPSANSRRLATSPQNGSAVFTVIGSDSFDDVVLRFLCSHATASDVESA